MRSFYHQLRFCGGISNALDSTYRMGREEYQWMGEDTRPDQDGDLKLYQSVISCDIFQTHGLTIHIPNCARLAVPETRRSVKSGYFSQKVRG